jgi:hypothetical protein
MSNRDDVLGQDALKKREWYKLEKGIKGQA